MVRGRTARFVLCCAASTLMFGLVGMAGPASADSGHSRHETHRTERRRDDSNHRRRHGHGHEALFVSPDGVSTNSGRSCESATFTSINDAVTAASAGDTVVVCEGTYAEDVLVNKALTLLGRHATIDATGLENGFWIVASDVRVHGFTVENANGEGVLAGVDAFEDFAMLPASGPVLSHVTVEYSNVINNDKGFNFTETGNCKYPGDCGGGIHFNGTTRSAMLHDTVTGNADGVLLTDDYAPSSHNLIEDNVVNDNVHECGIVLPSHAANAVTFDPNTFEVTAVNPTLGGVYDNIVRDNVTDNNGTDKAPPEFGGGGSGSGVGLFASGPGSAVYDNLIVDNEASGNGIAGIAIDAHNPGGEKIDGNVFVHNKLGTNNIGGDGFDGPPGPADFETTGIAIFSAVPAHMVISHNWIHDNSIGIWLSDTITAHGLDDNHFHDVTTPVVVG